MFVKGATKLYFTHYSCAAIILFNTGSYKSEFSTDSFGKTVFSFSTLFALGQVEFSVTLINFITFALHSHCLYKYQVLCAFAHTYF